jgi:hypothetical protein
LGTGWPVPSSCCQTRTWRQLLQSTTRFSLSTLPPMSSLWVAGTFPQQQC